MRFVLARRFGCPYGIESGMLWGMGLLLVLYGVTTRIELSLPVKALLALTVIGVTIRQIVRRISVRDLLTALVPSK